uniref:Uncharacterized protein n=1 Tax=virus sp. ct8MV80 TaxID=2826793 RepID=A0A8S5R828_9VIRU|nr:MAG TPA: hypothetical protein [virus sp. ct8MV80]
MTIVRRFPATKTHLFTPNHALFLQDFLHNWRSPINIKAPV